MPLITCFNFWSEKKKNTINTIEADSTARRNTLLDQLRDVS